MKRLFLLSALASLFVFTSVNAQTKKGSEMKGSQISIGPEFGFPVGDFGDAFDFGFGGSVMYLHPIAKNLKLTLNAGYLSFEPNKALKDVGVTASGTIPLKAGIRVNVAENVYLGGELGAGFSTKTGGKTAFAYAPGIGVEFPVADKMSVDLGGRYEGWSVSGGTSSFIGVRLALNFGL